MLLYSVYTCLTDITLSSSGIARIPTRGGGAKKN